jgi:hypothetical protein
MDGPVIQMPGPLAQMLEVRQDGDTIRLDMRPEWASFLSSLQQVSYYQTRSGTTAQRPTSTSYRWVGMPYYDTTLGYPVWLAIASSNAWVDATGSSA